MDGQLRRSHPAVYCVDEFYGQFLHNQVVAARYVYFGDKAYYDQRWAGARHHEPYVATENWIRRNRPQSWADMINDDKRAPSEKSKTMKKKFLLLLTVTLSAALAAHANDAALAVTDSGDLGLTREQMKTKYSQNWPYLMCGCYRYIITDKNGVKHELPAGFSDTTYSAADDTVNIIAHYSHHYDRADTVTAVEYVSRFSYFDDDYIEMLLRIHNLPVSEKLHNLIIMKKLLWPAYWIDKSHYIKCEYATEKQIASGFRVYESLEDEQKEPKFCHEVELGTLEAQNDANIIRSKVEEYYAIKKEGGKEEILPPPELVKAETDLNDAWKNLPVIIQNKLHDDQLKWAKHRDSYDDLCSKLDRFKERTKFLKEALEHYNQYGESAVWGTEPD